MAYPILAPQFSWYKTSTPCSNISKIKIVNTIDATEIAGAETWNADVNNTGAIKCYISDSTLIICGDGSGKIQANENSQQIFCKTPTAGFSAVLTIEGLEFLDFSKATTLLGAFAGLSSIKELDLSVIDVSSCRSMKNMFLNCGQIEKINVSNWNVQNAVLGFGNMFSNCQALKEIIGISDWNVNEQVNSITLMFNNCKNLKYLDLSNFKTGAISNFSRVFSGCENLVEIKGLNNWDTSAGKSFSYMFYGCSSLRKLDLSSFNTSNAEYSWQASQTAIGYGMHQMFGVGSILIGNEQDAPMLNLREVKIGPNFSNVGDNSNPDVYAVLPTPKPENISGADEKWYDEEGNEYEVSSAITLKDQTIYARNPKKEVRVKYSTIFDIADAIRAKSHHPHLLLPSEMETAILLLIE